MEQTVKTWRVLELLKTTENLLKEKNIENPRLNAELLLSDVLKEPRIKLYLDFEKPLSEQEISEYRTKIKRRLSREPLQYILGYSEFFGLRFKVTTDVLIPRPETEILVEKAIEAVSSFDMLNPKILEIGTGSGCISIAVANKVNCKIDAIDNSSEALDIAKHNSEILNTSDKISFSIKSIFKDFQNFEDYDIILSNPPYIAVDELKNTADEIRNFEPAYALTDGGDGLSFYKQIFKLINETQNQIKAVLEIGDGKRNKVEELLNIQNIKNYTFHKDYHGIDRVLYLNKEKN
jgi:release factor glutamine methyltransferase